MLELAAEGAESGAGLAEVGGEVGDDFFADSGGEFTALAGGCDANVERAGRVGGKDGKGGGGGGSIGNVVGNAETGTGKEFRD